MLRNQHATSPREVPAWSERDAPYSNSVATSDRPRSLATCQFRCAVATADHGGVPPFAQYYYHFNFFTELKCAIVGHGV
jgi:hypothetical protein